MKISEGRLRERIGGLRKTVDFLSENHPLSLDKLLVDVCIVLGKEIFYIQDQIEILEKKMDTHISTLRSDISKIRQSLKFFKLILGKDGE